MKQISIFILILLLSTFYSKGRQIQIGSVADNIQFSQILSGNDSSLYFLGKKNYNDYFIFKTNLQLDTLWSLTCSSASNYSDVKGYQLPGSGDIFIWDDDSTLLRITQNGQIISNTTISIPGKNFSGVGGMLYHHDSLLLALNFKDSVFHCGIAFADTNLNFTSFHEYTNQYITDIQYFRQGYYLKSGSILFLDSTFNYTDEMYLTGYMQYAQGVRVFGPGNVQKVNDSILFVHQTAQHSYEPTNNDHYFVLNGYGPGTYVPQKDDFDLEPSYNYKMLHWFSDGRKILLGENRTGGVYVYTLDSLYNPVSVYRIFLDTTSYSESIIPAIFLDDQIYFAYKNIIGTIDTSGNTCNINPATDDHGPGFSQSVYDIILVDTTYSLANSILTLQIQTSAHGIFTTDNCNLVGLDNIEPEKSFEIYPNPLLSGEKFSIASNQSFTRLTVRNISGTLLYQINNPESIITLPTLSAGAYLIEATNEKNAYIKLMIVQ